MFGEVLTAAVTPFHADSSVNYDAFGELCEYLVANGSDGIVVGGTTGESPTLTDKERMALTRVALDTVGERATVVAGTGTYSTSHSVHLTEEADALGVDGFLVVTPYYNKPPPAGIVAHFAAVAEVTERPILVYNIPQRVVINIEPSTMTELAEIPNVRAVKQATTDIDQARHIVEIGLDLYAGNDDLILPFLEVGGIGGVCVFTHLVGTRVKELIAAYNAGDLEGARAIDESLRPLVDALAVTTNPIPIKTALDLLGHNVGPLRLPLVAATDAEREQVRVGLETASLAAAS
ncbi:MAG: 4-hydroxy-tetrahydrodipicolinate synthase [Gaiellaceae bacterium]